MKMFHRIALVLALLIPTAALAQTTSNQYKTIKTNWTPPVITASTYPVCNFTANPPVNTLCENGYQEMLNPPAGTNAPSVTIPPCSATQSTFCIPFGVSTYSWTNGNYLYSGTWNISLATGYLDGNGVQQFSASATTTVNVPNPQNPPNPVTGLNATLAP